MKRYLVLFFIFCNFYSFGQVIEVSQIIQENKIVKFDKQKLILLDFWATWCAPCIPATEQLQVLQKKNTNKVFVLSITDEQVEKVTKFLVRKPFNLMVANDIGGQIFKKYNVSKRPYAVLLNLNGDVLWQGHPSNLTQRSLDYFANKNARIITKSFKEVVKTSVIKMEDVVDKYEISLAKNETFEDFYNQDETTTKFRGSFKNLLAKLLGTSKLNITSNVEDFIVDFKANNQFLENNKKRVINELCSDFKLQLKSSEENANSNEIIIEDSSKLWQADTFNWSEENKMASNFIIGEESIQADNITISQLADLLSDVKGELYIYKGNDTNKYDWDLIYKFEDLFTTGLQDNFGIKIKTNTTLVPKYTVTNY
ncbi:TlpA family protein disulfide reductase [Flavobacterium sp.]|uniref:TlpA family protein disulfide reductase n=1 Tax=Flavobacterium sp. TaxID=239 RepID=UPI003529AF6E